MRILFIGGTGTISSAITRRLASSGHELWLLNRGNRANEVPENVKQIVADINDEAAVSKKLGDTQFDAVCDFIAFVPSQVERDYRLFRNRTRQYVFISSASAYHKPARNYIIDEGTALANPHWQYSRDKIACEELLMHLPRRAVPRHHCASEPHLLRAQRAPGTARHKRQLASAQTNARRQARAGAWRRQLALDHDVE